MKKETTFTQTVLIFIWSMLSMAVFLSMMLIDDIEIVYGNNIFVGFIIGGSHALWIIWTAHKLFYPK